jgi:hypothetical protein
MLFLHWGYATTYAFHSLLLYENLSSCLTSKREAWATEKSVRENKRAKSSGVQKERVRKRK